MVPGFVIRQPNNALVSGLAPWAVFEDSLVPEWEVWWTRNRLHYLPFKEPIDWGEDPDEAKDPDSKKTIGVKIQSRKKGIDALTECLKDDHNLTKANTLIAMAKFRDKKLEEHIKKFLTDKNRYVRDNAVLSLGIMGDPANVKNLKKILFGKKSKINTRSYAALALGYINDKASIKALQEVFVKRHRMRPEIKCVALLSLGNLENPATIPFLGKILQNKREKSQIRSCAAVALGRIKDKKALPFLKKALKEKKSDIQGSVAVALGLIKSEKSKKDLLKLLTKGRGSQVKGLAAISLGQLSAPSAGKGGKSAAKLLLKATKKGGYNLQGFSILALGMLNDEEGTRELRNILVSKKKYFVRGAAALALGMLKDKESVPVLIKIVEKEGLSDPVAWSYAILALGMIGDKRAVPILEELFEKVQDPGQELLANAGYNNITVALAMLGRRAEVLKILHEKLASADKSVLSGAKWKILHGIGYVGDETSIDPLMNFYKNEKDGKVRAYAAMALGFVLDKDKINPLYKITSEGNHNIRLDVMIDILFNRPD